jgi:predicted membrane protein
VFRSQSFIWSYRLVLGTSLAAIISITIIGYLSKLHWPFSPMLLMGLPIFGTFIAYFIALVWYSTRQWRKNSKV